MEGVQIRRVPPVAAKAPKFLAHLTHLTTLLTSSLSYGPMTFDLGGRGGRAVCFSFWGRPGPQNSVCLAATGFGRYPFVLLGTPDFGGGVLLATPLRSKLSVQLELLRADESLGAVMPDGEIGEESMIRQPGQRRVEERQRVRHCRLVAQHSAKSSTLVLKSRYEEVFSALMGSVELAQWLCFWV